MPFNKAGDQMRNWKTAGFAATVIFVVAFPLYIVRITLNKSKIQTEEETQFVGRNSCIECPKKENAL